MDRRMTEEKSDRTKTEIEPLLGGDVFGDCPGAFSEA
jgi:hypothetical protein